MSRESREPLGLPRHTERGNKGLGIYVQEKARARVRRPGEEGERCVGAARRRVERVLVVVRAMEGGERRRRV